jgi:hypothetical protein
MELCEFRERVYGKHNKNLFVFESSWGAFRPIEGVGWNGREVCEVDARFKKDLFSPFYGYGSQAMKQACDYFTKHIELEDRKPIADVVGFWKWCGVQNASWWRDRPCVFTSNCVPRSPDDWKRYVSHLQSKPKTLRQGVSHRMTKRVKSLVPK